MPKFKPSEHPDGLFVSQPQLFAAIIKWLGKAYKVKWMPTIRRINAIIAACNLIVDAFKQPDRNFEPGCGLGRWLASDHVGASSMFMAHVMAGAHCRDADMKNHPHDPDDFSRCLGLYAAMPELREKLPMMAEHGLIWKGLVENWDELERLYFEEEPTGSAPKLHERMQRIISEGRSA